MTSDKRDQICTRVIKFQYCSWRKSFGRLEQEEQEREERELRELEAALPKEEIGAREQRRMLHEVEELEKHITEETRVSAPLHGTRSRQDRTVVLRYDVALPSRARRSLRVSQLSPRRPPSMQC